MGSRRPHAGLVLPAIVAGLLALAPAAGATTYNVKIQSDEADLGPLVCAPTDNDCSLREAIIAANGNATNDIIAVPSGNYVLDRPTGDDNGVNGDLDVLDSTSRGTLKIFATGARRVTIAGAFDPGPPADKRDRVFDVHSKADLEIAGVTILGGVTPGDGGGIRIDGGAASPPATVTLRNSTLRINTALRGGAIAALQNSSLTLINSTLSANSAGNAGGAIWNAPVCGGCTAALSLQNSTLSGNSQTVPGASNGGGGVTNEGTATLDHVTIASNTAKSHGGGIQPVAGSVTVKNSIVTANTSGFAGQGNCSAPITSNGFNLEFGTTCGFGQSSDLNASAKLNPLADNGGPTNTQYPRFDSAALNNADSVGCPATDQRGISRPKGAGCDRGAVEAEPTDMSLAMTDGPDPVPSNDPFTYTITVRNLGTSPAYGVTVTDPLPSSLHFGTTSATQGSCSNTQTEVCSLGTIPAGGDATLTITVSRSQAGSVSNTATVSMANVDTNGSNNAATRTTTVTLRPGPCANGQVGTVGPDTLNGTSKGDFLRGLAGNDILKGFAGDDCLEGGNGSDTLNGGGGKDSLKGGNANDTISAADGKRDTIDCGPGGNDKATVDSHDVVKNCEVVTGGANLPP